MNKAKVLSKINPLFLQGIAHRGLHNDKYTENGMNAFSNAVRHGVAIELDIHLTKDNQLVVCHDEDLKRTTGTSGIIEDLTLEEIKKYRLLDGGEIPTFIEVLDFVKEQVPIVVELKVFRKNYKALAAKVFEVMKEKVMDKKNFLLISFDPRSLWPLKKLGIIRSLLATCGEYFYVYRYFRHTVESVDLDQTLFDKKQIQKYHNRYFVNAWTIENEEQLKNVLPYVDTVTFQHMDENIVRKYLKK